MSREGEALLRFRFLSNVKPHKHLKENTNAWLSNTHHSTSPRGFRYLSFLYCTRRIRRTTMTHERKHTGGFIVFEVESKRIIKIHNHYTTALNHIHKLGKGTHLMRPVADRFFYKVGEPVDKLSTTSLWGLSHNMKSVHLTHLLHICWTNTRTPATLIAYSSESKSTYMPIYINTFNKIYIIMCVLVDRLLS